MTEDYFAFERDIGRHQLAPMFQGMSLDLNHKRVLDVGCGYGGVLQGLVGAYPLMQGLGLDRDADMLAAGEKRLSPTLQLLHRDFFDFTGEPFDVLLLRDVLEHIGDYGQALRQAKSLLKPHGRLYITFAPFLGPFGGHQHNGYGLAAKCPWLQLLPEVVFRGLLKVKGNTYKGSAALNEDMHSVLSTRLTLKKFFSAMGRTGLHIHARRFYLSRPEYRLKFNWPTVQLPDFPGFPGVIEGFCTGVEIMAGLEKHPTKA